MMKVIDMMHRVPNTRKKHLEVTQGRKHDDEMHLCWGAECYWYIDDVTYIEEQSDIGPTKWYVIESE